MADPKVFDVSPPKTDDIATAPTVRPTRKIMLDEPTLEQGKSANPDIEEVAKKAEETTVSRQGASIKPPSESKTEETEVEPEISATDNTTDTEKLPAEPAEETEMPKPETSEPEPEKEEPIKEAASTDSILPDTSQRATAAAKESMESPAMFDTKAYYVPIGNSHHRHGGVFGAILAALVAAALVVGAILYFGNNL